MEKRLYYMSDLYDFFINEYKSSMNFSAKETGRQLFVQVPAKFEVVDNEYEDNTLLFCKVKLMHSGENRNHSNVTDEALVKASKGLAYKPILANFMEYTDEKTGEVLKDFTFHDMVMNSDNTTTYLEKQIGCFTSDEPYFEVEEETGHNFLYGYCAIPRDYTDATSIIERKGGTKISVELAVNEMNFDASNKVLNLTDVIIMGATCLGKDPETLKDVGEGMQNARLDIADFSAENNSILNNYQSQMVEFQARLEKLENACFNKSSLQEGGNENIMFEELLKKYGKTVEEIEFDYSDLSDEELEAKFAEVFGKTDEATSDDTDTPDDKEDDTPSTEDASTEDESAEGDVATDETTESIEDFSEKMSKEDLFNQLFEISFNEIQYALNTLCSVYRTDSEWCYVSQVYDDYFIMEDWDNDKYYKQSYTKDGDNIALSGERIEMFAMLLTESEKLSIDEMRANYSSLVEFKDTVEKNELHAKREEILANEKYASLKDNEEFKTLVKNMDNYSLADLEKEAKIIFADNVSIETFAAKKDAQPSIKLFTNMSKTKKDNRYGNLFSK